MGFVCLSFLGGVVYEVFVVVVFVVVEEKLSFI